MDELINNFSLKLMDENPNYESNLENIGYVIYTSGSTGKPKGVMLPHKALSNLMQWHRTRIPEKRNVLQFTALSFDMSFLEIFSALSSGGTLSLISEQDRMDPWRFARLVKQNRVQQLVLPVPFFKYLAEVNLGNYFTHLKEVILAGEQLIITPAISSFFSQLNSCKLLNYYGPSETHVVIAYEFPKNLTDWLHYAPIGKPISNTNIILLNDRKKLVAIGQPGEIYVKGLCLARGYINRNELTEENFIPDPWSDKANARLYRTGDMGKYLPDGNLVFLGRKDEQIKIRGFRIEPVEIESHLIKHPRVREAVVIAKDDITSEKHLKAFLVVEGDECDKLINSIYAFLQENLPPHMVPSVFNIIESMPLTDSGKIDRLALSKYKQSITHSANKFVEAKTQVEKEIIAVMESVFKRHASLDHSFSSVGGNSLLAMQIVTKLKDKFSIELPPYTLLSDPTIRETAKRIDALIAKSDTLIRST